MAKLDATASLEGRDEGPLARLLFGWRAMSATRGCWAAAGTVP